MSVPSDIDDPLPVAELAFPGGGTIGMLFCPGRRHMDGLGGRWVRDLDRDVEALRAWGATALLTLIEDHEFDGLGVPHLGERVRGAGIEWHHLPIPDMGVPDAVFEAGWAQVGPLLHARLARNERVAVHCAGGLGRTGTIIARLLIEAGAAPEEAIRRVRVARPGAIESTAQEIFLAGLTAAGPGSEPKKKS